MSLHTTAVPSKRCAIRQSFLSNERGHNIDYLHQLQDSLVIQKFVLKAALEHSATASVGQTFSIQQWNAVLTENQRLHKILRRLKHQRDLRTGQALIAALITERAQESERKAERDHNEEIETEEYNLNRKVYAASKLHSVISKLESQLSSLHSRQTVQLQLSPATLSLHNSLQTVKENVKAAAFRLEKTQRQQEELETHKATMDTTLTTLKALARSPAFTNHLHLALSSRTGKPDPQNTRDANESKATLHRGHEISPIKLSPDIQIEELRTLHAGVAMTVERQTARVRHLRNDMKQLVNRLESNERAESPARPQLTRSASNVAEYVVAEWLKQDISLTSSFSEFEEPVGSVEPDSAAMACLRILDHSHA